MSKMINISITRSYRVDFSGIKSERIEAIKEDIFNNEYDIDALSKELDVDVEAFCSTYYEAIIDDEN